MNQSLNIFNFPFALLDDAHNSLLCGIVCDEIRNSNTEPVQHEVILHHTLERIEKHGRVGGTIVIVHDMDNALARLHVNVAVHLALLNLALDNLDKVVGALSIPLTVIRLVPHFNVEWWKKLTEHLLPGIDAIRCVRQHAIKALVAHH